MDYFETIDISPWINKSHFSDVDRSDVCRKWNDAFERVGFAVIVGHGISGDILSAVSEEARKFFSRDLESKMIFNRGPYGNPDGGYTPSGSETVSLSLTQSSSGHMSSPDPVESFVMLPCACSDEFKTALPECWAHTNRMESLLHNLHEMTTRSLRLDEIDYFRKYYDASDPNALGSGAPSYSLRLAYYPRQECKSEDVNSKTCRYGPHTDYMGFTILRADPSDWRDGACDTGGLEVWIDIEKKWVPVRIPPEHAETALIVNAGDLFQRWTNDKWKSALHRVSNPAPDSPAWGRDRFSLVFFSGPMNDVIVETIFGSEEGIVKYAPVRAGDYLLSKISPTARTETDVSS